MYLQGTRVVGNILQCWGPFRLTEPESRGCLSSAKEPWGPCIPRVWVSLMFPSPSSLQDGWSQHYISV